MYVMHTYTYFTFISELSRDRRSSARIYMSLTLHYISSESAYICSTHTHVVFLSIMKAIATFLQPTSAVASLKTTLTEDKDTEFLVVAKSCSIEVFAILPDGIRLRCSESIWGRITSMHDIPTDVSTLSSCTNVLLIYHLVGFF